MGLSSHSRNLTLSLPPLHPFPSPAPILFYLSSTSSPHSSSLPFLPPPLCHLSSTSSLLLFLLLSFPPLSFLPSLPSPPLSPLSPHQMQLSQKERECQELELFREIPPGSSGEAQALRRKLGLAEAAARAAREKEHQMKEVRSL